MTSVLVRSILVTGGAGFIGSNFVRWVLSTQPAGSVRILNLDALTYAGCRSNLEGLAEPEHHTFIEGDIGDKKLVARLLRKHQVDTVVHFAAETHVDRSIHAPELFFKTNVLGTVSFLEETRRYWTEKDATGRRSPEDDPTRKLSARPFFHQVSTDEVFGSLGPNEAAWKENAPYAPNSPYAASKAGSDHLVRAYGHTYGLPFTITNCSNNYGPYQFPEKLIPLTIANALEGKELPIYGDGKQVRDWIFVQDHCEAIWNVIQHGRPGETYNVGAADFARAHSECTNLEIVTMICRILDEIRPASPHRPHRNLVRFVEDRPGHDKRYALDSSKIRSELGWRPRHSLDEGLMKTVKWYLENPGWVATIRQKGDYESWAEQNYGKRKTTKAEARP